MGHRTAIIQLARMGDLCSILPVAYAEATKGNSVTFYSHPQFAPILEPVNYVDVYPWDVGHRDVRGAAAHAKAAGFDRILVTQVDGNPDKPPVDTENFITQQWARAGYLDDFHHLPLVFNRRDHEGESKAMRRHLPAKNPDRPLLCYALHGHSSPFYRFHEFEVWLANFSDRYQLLDIGKLDLPKPHHLLPFIQAADVLVTIDTLHLHLSHAFNTPTIALSIPNKPNGERQGREHYWSEPRDHWLAHLDYDRANTPEGRSVISDILTLGDFEPGRCVRGAAEVVRERIHHVVDWYCPEGHPDRRRILNARQTWESLVAGDGHWEMVWHETDRHAKRTARDLGDARKLPYITDIIDFGCRNLPDDAIVCWTNSDVSLCPDAPAAIRHKLKTADCCYSRRVDVPDGSVRLRRADLSRMTAHVGADLFAFRVRWWKQHRDEMPDLFLAAEAWDWVARHVMKKHEAQPEIKPPIVYHERHASPWAQDNRILSDPSQLHNRKAAERFARENNLAGALHDGKFLFKADGAW